MVGEWHYLLAIFSSGRDLMRLHEMLLLLRKSWTALFRIQSPGKEKVKMPLVYLGRWSFQKTIKWWKNQNQ